MESSVVNAKIPTKGNRVFVLGSGYSRAATGDELANYPTLSRLSELVISEIRANEETNSIAKSLLKWNLPPYILNNIEYLLSFLWEDQPWHDDVEKYHTKAMYFYVVKIIQDIFIKQPISPIDEAIQLAEYWRDNLSTLISFNYDMIVENIALKVISDLNSRLEILYQIPITHVSARKGKYGLDTYPPQKNFSLLKLHGSINWLYSADQSFSGQPIYWVFKAEEIKEHDDLNPVIIPPVMDKSKFYLHSGLKRQWRLAKEALANAQEIYFIGYSLPETDLSVRFFLGEALKNSSAKLYIIILEGDSQKAEFMKKRYLELINNKTERLDFRNVKRNSLSEVISLL